jgi:post-segregation antitoxin (ccd killing protein)
MRTIKKTACIYIEAELLDRARKVSERLGVSISHLLAIGLRPVLKRYEAAATLMWEDEE